MDTLQSSEASTTVDASPNAQTVQRALVELSVEAWRCANGIERSLVKLDEAPRKRAINQVRWLQRSVANALEAAGLRLVDVTAQPYDTGIPAAPLNLDDFSADADLTVERMLEPIIMGSSGIVHNGTVVLARTNARQDQP
jgi:hypothetical protein